MDSVFPVINRGVISYWLEDKPSEPAMLVVGSDGNVSHQAIPVTEWGSISGSLEDQSDLTLVLGALDSAKVNKAGDTMTGNLTINNSSSVVRLNNNGQDWQLRAQYGDLNIEPVSTANSVFVRAGSGQQVTLTVAGINRISATANGASVTGDIRSDRAGSLSPVSPQNNIVLYGGFAGYGIGFDSNGELATVVNSTLRSRLGQHLGLGSAGQVRFNSAADTSGSWDTLVLRNATGPTVETRAAGGLRVRTLDGSAAAGLDCGAITASGTLNLTSTAPTINFTGTGGIIYDDGYCAPYVRSYGFRMQGYNINYQNSGLYWGVVPSASMALVSDNSADILALRNATSPTTFRIYNTYTSATNGEWLQQQWTSNEARIGTAVGSAGGTQRSLVLGSWNAAGTWSPGMRFETNGNVGDITFGSGSQMTFSGRGTLRWPNANIFRIADSAVTSGFSFDVTTNGTATLRNLDNSAAGALACGVLTSQYGATTNDIVAISNVGTVAGQTNAEGVKWQLVTASGADSLRLASTSFVGFNSTGNLNTGSIDASIRRNASGPTLDTWSAGGLRVRSADGSAVGALDAGQVISRQSSYPNASVRLEDTPTTANQSAQSGVGFYYHSDGLRKAGIALDNASILNIQATAGIGQGTTVLVSPSTPGMSIWNRDVLTYAPLQCGAITTNGRQTISRSTFGSYGSYLVCNNESGYSEVELQQGLSSGYGGTLTLRAGNLANTGYLRLRYDAGYCKLETNNNALTLAAGTAMMRLTDAYHDFHGNGGHWLTMDSQNFDKYNGTNPQTMRVFNTRTSSTNFETLQTQWVSNEARIGTAVGSAGGTQRNMVLGSWNAAGTWTQAMSIRPSDPAYPVKFHGTTGIWIGDSTTLENARLWTSSNSFQLVNAGTLLGTGSMKLTDWNASTAQSQLSIQHTKNLTFAIDTDNDDTTSAFYFLGGTDASGNPATNGIVKFEKGGNVGIGTMTPSAKLHVNGTVRVDATTTHDIRTSAGGQVATIGNVNSHCLIRAQATAYPLGLYGSGNGIRIGDGTYTVDLKPDGANNTLGIYTGQGTSSAFSGAIANLNVGAITTSGNLTLNNGTTATRLDLYGTYTDASNYRRLYISSTTGGVFTLGVEGLGTGASGNTLTVANATSFSSNITLGDGQRIYLMSDYSIRAATRTGTRRNPLLISIPYNGGDAEDRIDICRVQEGGTPTAVEFINGVGYIYNIGIARLSTSGNFYVGGANFSGLGNVSNSYIANLFGYYEVRLGNSSNGTQPVKFDWFNNLATFSLPVLLSSTLTLGTSGVLVGGTNLIEQRNSTNAQTWRLYGTYTDSSNYRRLYIGSTTAGAFTFGVEGLGTGVSGNTLAISTTTITTNPGYSNSQAFGPGHSMVGAGVTLIGSNINQGYSTSTVGIGYNINAAGRNSVYIGNSNTAPTPGSVVANAVSIGDSVTTGTVCVAVGAQSSAAQFSTVIGYAASDSDGGVAIGRLATCTLSQPIAIGNTATATVRGIAIGYVANAGTRSIALGQNTVAFQDSIAIGNTAVTTAVGQLHFGSSAGPISMVSFPGATFSRINLGDATSANPAIKRNGTAINFRLADDSADAPISAARITTPSILLSGNFSTTAWTTDGVGISHTTRTLTDTSSSGTVATAYTNVLGGNTIAASNATTYTDYASLFLGNPTAGTNVTITNSFSLITAGAARFGGSITTSGIATINGGTQNTAGIQLSGSTAFGPYGSSSGWTFVQASAAQMRFSGGGIVLQSGKTLAWGNAFTDAGTTQLWEDASHVIAQRNSTNAQRFNLYGTYTDSSNYRRLFLTSSTGGTFTIGSEGAGTGASGNTLVLTAGGVTYLTLNNWVASLAQRLAITVDSGGSSGDAGSLLAMYNQSGGTAATGLRVFASTGGYTNTGSIAVFGRRSGIGTYEDVLRIVGTTAAGAIQFGGVTTAEPMLKRSGTSIQVRLADDSADAPITASDATLSGILTHGIQDLSADPTTSDIPSNRVRVVRNTTSGEVRIWANDGGTMLSILFTAPPPPPPPPPPLPPAPPPPPLPPP